MAYDIVGYEDIVGGEYVVGEELASNNGLRQQIEARQGRIVRESGPKRVRQFPLGFPTTTINAAASATITAQTQVVFRPRRLLIPSDIAGSLLVNDLKVGKNSMFPSADPIPARVFSENAVGVDLQLDTAQVSQLISLSLSNTSGANVSFNACVIGDALE
jgi:hypothetical protein